jgi:hypothetical protein
MGNHLLGMSWVVRTKSGQVDEEASSKNILGHLVSEMAICTKPLARQGYGSVAFG